MWSEPVIRTRGLGKAYHLYATPRDRLFQLLLGAWQKFYREAWAVRGLDLEIHQGETLGIVGRNGSGKSTLLEMLSGTVTPTRGEYEVRGKVAALLELGTGFNPEFSGRENVRLYATILGLTPREIGIKLDGILRFADIGAYIDHPLKTYSTGMRARLAFAVAISVEPDILIVDEALAVGDEAFQRKCISAMENIRAAGATVIIVSHSVNTIIEVCTRAILLDGGECLMSGEPKAVVGRYQRLLYAPAERVADIREKIRAGAPLEDPKPAGDAAGTAGPADGDDGAWFDPGLVPESTVPFECKGAEISAPEFRTARGKRVNVLRHGMKLRFTYEVRFAQDFERVRFGMMLRSVNGVDIGGQTSHGAGDGVGPVRAGETLKISFPVSAALMDGSYFANAGVLAVSAGEESFAHRILDAVMFRIEGGPAGRVTGYADLSDGGEVLIEAVDGAAAAGTKISA